MLGTGQLSMGEVIRTLGQSIQAYPAKEQAYQELSAIFNKHRKQIRAGTYHHGEEMTEESRLLGELIRFIRNIDTLAPVDSATSLEERLLFLAANPSQTARLRLDIEQREVQECLKRAKRRDLFTLETAVAVRPLDLYRAMLETNPTLVHFSGHGEVISNTPQLTDSRALEFTSKDGIETDSEGLMGGIMLLHADQQDEPQLVSAYALRDLFANFTSDLKLVFLNACYSQIQAEAIHEYVPYVIGMKQAVNDLIAIAFARAFYDALGAGRDIHDAFQLAKDYLKVEGLAGGEIPQILSR